MAPFLSQRISGKVTRLKTLFADSAYEGLPGGLVWRCFHWLLQIVRGEEEADGFEPLPKRWVIERTFGWFGTYRRLCRDYEYHPETSETMLRAVMACLMLRRIT